MSTEPLKTKTEICNLIGKDAPTLIYEALRFAKNTSNASSTLTPQQKATVRRLLNKYGTHDVAMPLRKIFCQGGGRHTRRAKRSSRRTRHAKRQ
jgi:hypothetical protein